MRHAQQDLNSEKQSASSVRAMNISKVINVSRVAMSAKDAVVGLISALTAKLHQNYLQDSVFAKIASTKIRAFAKLVGRPVRLVSTVINVKHAPADLSLVTLFA